mgnify:CR=1 FL=1
MEKNKHSENSTTPGMKRASSKLIGRCSRADDDWWRLKMGVRSEGIRLVVSWKIRIQNKFEIFKNYTKWQFPSSNDMFANKSTNTLSNLEWLTCHRSINLSWKGTFFIWTIATILFVQIYTYDINYDLTYCTIFIL